MTTSAPSTESIAQKLEALRPYRLWFIGLGILMVILGAFAISWACLTTVTIAVTWVFGAMLLGGGIAEIIGSFRSGRGGSRLLHLLMGVIYAVAGFMIMDEPGKSAIQLTLIAAIFMIVVGLFRIMFAVSESGPGSRWILLNGIVTFILGIMIYKQWPASGLWVIGMFLGIELLLNGWSWIGFGLGLGAKPNTPDAKPALV